MALPTAGPTKGPLVLGMGTSLLKPLGPLNEEPETQAGSLALDSLCDPGQAL